MKKLISMILILTTLLATCNFATAIWTPGLEVRTGSNVTLTNGYLVGAKLGQSSHVLTVGTASSNDYVTDNTSDQIEINAAIAAADGKKEVVLVDRIYTVNWPINVSVQGTNIHGINQGAENRTASATTIVPAVGSTTIDLIHVRGSNSYIHDLHLRGAGTMTGGYGLNMSQTSYSAVERLSFDHLYNGIRLYKDSVDSVRNCRTWHIINNNVECWYGNEIYLSEIEMVGDSAAQSSKGLYVKETVHVNAVNLAIMECGNNMYADDLTTGYFTNCLFDQGTGGTAAGILLKQTTYGCQFIGFDNCWIATSTAAGYTGVDISGALTKHIGFDNCIFHNVAWVAININESSRITISDCRFYDPDLVGAGAAVAIQSAASHIVLTGNVFEKVSGACSNAIWNSGDYITSTGNDYGGLGSTITCVHKVEANNLA